MPKEPVFYSFHFSNDVFRVQQVRNMGLIDGNEAVSPNEWEQLKRSGTAAIERWIDATMKYKRCVIVLVGSETANREWVKYEIKKAWDEHRGLFGIYIHGLRCPRTGTCAQGVNPFSSFSVAGVPMSNLVPCYDPGTYDAYGEISRNLQGWVASAILQAKAR